MLFVLLSAATFGLWLAALPIIALIAIFVLIAWDDYNHPKYGWALFTFVALLAFFLLFTDVPVWTFIAKTWVTILEVVAAWVLIGAIWSIPRWIFFYLPERVEDYEKNKDQWAKDYTKSYDKDRYTLKEWLLNSKDVPPSPKRNKARIVSWMWSSVLDILYCLLHKAVKRFFNWVFSLFQGIYAAASARAFAHFDELK